MLLVLPDSSVHMRLLVRIELFSRVKPFLYRQLIAKIDKKKRSKMVNNSHILIEITIEKYKIRFGLFSHQNNL